jgi:hypothetical protein
VSVLRLHIFGTALSTRLSSEVTYQVPHPYKTRVDETQVEYTRISAFPLRKFVQTLKIWIYVQKLYRSVFGEATDFLN